MSEIIGQKFNGIFFGYMRLDPEEGELNAFHPDTTQLQFTSMSDAEKCIVSALMCSIFEVKVMLR